MTPASSGTQLAGTGSPPCELFGSPHKSKASAIVKAVSSAAAQALQPKSVQPVADSLYTRVATIPCFSTLLPSIRGCSSASKLSSVLTGGTTTFMNAPNEAIKVLQGWQHWLKDNNLLVASQQQNMDALDNIALAMADLKRSWDWSHRAAQLAVDVPDFATYDKRLAQATVPTVDALMAVNSRATFWSAIVDLLVDVGVPDILRAGVAKLTGHGGQREERPSWASKIVATALKPAGGPRGRRARQSSRRFPGRRHEDEDSDISSDSGLDTRHSCSPGRAGQPSGSGRRGTATSPGPRLGSDRRGHDADLHRRDAQDYRRGVRDLDHRGHQDRRDL